MLAPPLSVHTAAAALFVAVIAPASTARGPKQLVFISLAPISTEVAVALPISNALSAAVSISPRIVIGP